MLDINASPAPVESITLDGELSISMNVGGTKMLNYNILPTNATNKNVTYTTSNSNVVFVDSNGVIYAMNTGVSLVTITTEDGKAQLNILKAIILNIANIFIPLYPFFFINIFKRFQNILPKFFR